MDDQEWNPTSIQSPTLAGLQAEAELRAKLEEGEYDEKAVVIPTAHRAKIVTRRQLQMKSLAQRSVTLFDRTCFL